MPETNDDLWSVERVRAAARQLSHDLMATDRSASMSLAAAADEVGSKQETLLALRSALVATRRSWERLESPAVVTEARNALAAGKRLAIALD